MKTIAQEIPDFTKCKPYQFTEKKNERNGSNSPLCTRKIK